MKARKVKKLSPTAPLADNAARILAVRLDELRSFAPRALEPRRSRDQHDMRIAAKRLRYVLEATEFCFGPPARDARKAAKRLQEVLGELHDCDVMLPLIADHTASVRAGDVSAVRAAGGESGDLDPALSGRAPGRAAYRGLAVLSVHVEARRRLLFDRFSELWAEQERSGTWTELERALERPAGAGRRSVPSAPG